MPAARRWFVLVCGLALAAAGCTSGKNAASPAPSALPTATGETQNVTNFQLVGTAQHAFAGIGPGFDTSAQATSNPGSTPLATAASGTTFGTPGQPGVVRVRIDDASDALQSSCSATRDETIDVFWTTGTQFDQSLLSNDLESSLEGRTLGIVGRLFTAPSGSDVIAQSTPSTSASPAPTANPQCVLVADQIGTSNGTIPTAVPRTAVRTARPTARATVTSAPTASPRRSPTPVPTVAPTPVATVTPTAT
jgi:hypothetical protein